MVKRYSGTPCTCTSYEMYMYISWIRASAVYYTVMEPSTAVHVVFQLASLLIRVNSPI